jgi:hypothetical protein
MCHSAPSVRWPHLRVQRHRCECDTPRKLLLMLPFRGQKFSLMFDELRNGIATSFESPSESPRLPHFGPHFISYFPLWHNEARDQGRAYPYAAFDWSRLVCCCAVLQLSRWHSRTAIWLDLVEPKPVPSFRRYPVQMCAIGYRQGAFRRTGLQQPQKNHRARREQMGESDALSGIFVPFELAPLHEKRMCAVPAGNFDRVAIGKRSFGSQEHTKPLRQEIAYGRPRRVPATK